MRRSSLTGRLLPMRELPAWSDEMAGVAVGIALEGVLVLRFRFPERPGWLYPRDHPPPPPARGGHPRRRFRPAPPLPVLQGKNGPPVAPTHVVPQAGLRWPGR